MNLFTSHLYKNQPIYVCLLLNPIAMKEDVFQHPWHLHDVYAFPLAMISRVDS